MTDIGSTFASLVALSFEREIIKKLVFSRPRDSEIEKVSARLCAHRGRKFLAAEYSLPGNTVSQRNIGRDALGDFLAENLAAYGQANLITTLGDAEWKTSKKGSEVLLGADKLKRKIDGTPSDAERAIESLDRRKSYILAGNEPFLIRLGISSDNGRVHDKRQGKFRQINRFLEEVEKIYSALSPEGELTVYDLCSGKSYLGFALYHYLTELKGRSVNMLSVDLKRDVVLACESTARELGFTGMRFMVEDIKNLPSDQAVDMVVSLHACDVATDVVLSSAVRLGAKVILSTPCCHSYLKNKINAPELAFVTELPHLKNKLSEALTDALRVGALRAEGYSVTVAELVDPDNTPKNTLIRAVRKNITETEREKLREDYGKSLEFILGDGARNYLKDVL